MHVSRKREGKQTTTMVGRHAASLLVLAALSLESTSFILPLPPSTSTAARRTAGGTAIRSSASRGATGRDVVVRSTTDKVSWYPPHMLLYTNPTETQAAVSPLCCVAVLRSTSCRCLCSTHLTYEYCFWVNTELWEGSWESLLGAQFLPNTHVNWRLYPRGAEWGVR